MAQLKLKFPTAELRKFFKVHFRISKKKINPTDATLFGTDSDDVARQTELSLSKTIYRIGFFSTRFPPP